MQKILVEPKKPIKLKVTRLGTIQIDAPFSLERGKRKPKGVKIIPVSIQ